MAKVRLMRWPKEGRRPAEYNEAYFPGLTAARLVEVRQAIVRWHETLNHVGGKKVGTWAQSCVPQSEAGAFLERNADTYADVLAFVRRDGVTAMEMLYTLTMQSKSIEMEDDR